MGRHPRCPGSPQAAPRTTGCHEEALLSGRSSTWPARRLARRLLVGAGLVVALWAFGALGRAHADTVPPRTALIPAAAQPRPILRTIRIAGENPLYRATVRRLPHRLVPPPIDPIAKPPPLPPIRHAVVPKRQAAPYRKETGGGPGTGCVRPRTPISLTPARRRATHAPSTGPLPPTAAARPVVAAVRPAPAPLRLKPTGTITHGRPDRIAGVDLAAPVPAPVSGSGGTDGGGVKTPSGTGDVPSFGRPPSGPWTIVPQPAARARRNLADQPSFSPD